LYNHYFFVYDSIDFRTFNFSTLVTNTYTYVDLMDLKRYYFYTR